MEHPSSNQSNSINHENIQSTRPVLRRWRGCARTPQRRIQPSRRDRYSTPPTLPRHLHTRQYRAPTRQTRNLRFCMGITAMPTLFRRKLLSRRETETTQKLDTFHAIPTPKPPLHLYRKCTQRPYPTRCHSYRTRSRINHHPTQQTF